MIVRVAGLLITKERVGPAPTATTPTTAKAKVAAPVTKSGKKRGRPKKVR